MYAIRLNPRDFWTLARALRLRIDYDPRTQFADADEPHREGAFEGYTVTVQGQELRIVSDPSVEPGRVLEPGQMPRISG